MSATVKIKCVSTAGPLFIAALRKQVEPGEKFDCPADLAGRAPGGWREPTSAESKSGLRGLVSRRGSGTLEVRDPGEGLLATGNFEKVSADRPVPHKTAAEKVSPVDKEGE